MMNGRTDKRLDIKDLEGSDQFDRGDVIAAFIITAFSSRSVIPAFIFSGS
jgi:hypothetical protein